MWRPLRWRRIAAIVPFAILSLNAADASSCVSAACGQPVSRNGSATTADALAILRAAVNLPSACSRAPCACDVNANNRVDTSDARVVLLVAVGLPHPPLGCPGTCFVGSCAACTSALFRVQSGSDLDVGWTGSAHDLNLPSNPSIAMDVARRCANTNEFCTTDEDCGASECVSTCDCSVDTTCELTGPAQPKRCLNSLAQCEANRCQTGHLILDKPCNIDADCGDGSTCTGSEACSDQPCVAMLGAPLPLSPPGVPVCIVARIDGPVTGTANVAFGQLDLSMNLQIRVHLGLTLESPCPQCGRPDENPQIGDVFTCNGGASDGKPCTVEFVSEHFGGASFDCPPEVTQFTTDIAVPLRRLTTQATTATANLPCAGPGFPNPLVPGSNPKCLDTPGGQTCTTNGDCRRCTGDPTIACTTNAECPVNSPCAEAPDQPISCGFWCSCGFCDGEADLPCLATSDCPAGKTCTIGTGSSVSQKGPQAKPNACTADGNVCGVLENERCANTVIGSCSEKPYLGCEPESTTCELKVGGECIVKPRSCFEPRITRSGEPSPLGSYCAYEDKVCTTNSDCAGTGDFCAGSVLRPQMAGLFCMPGTTSPSINDVVGLTGPAAVRLHGYMTMCYCGDSRIGCSEECDDGNDLPGDGCDSYCRKEP